MKKEILYTTAIDEKGILIKIGDAEKTKEYFRKNYPNPVHINELAVYIGVKYDRASRLIDILSGSCMENDNSVTDFLVYCNDESKPVTYGIFKDVEKGIYAL